MHVNLYDISIVIPIWNEEKWINRCYTEIKKFLTDNLIQANIVFATDGCTDNTPEIIANIKKNDETVIHFDDKNRLGRGLALKRVFQNLDAQYIIYMDSDLATELKHLPELINYLKNGSDIVTGSRLMKDSLCIRKTKRSFFSKSYNFLIRLLFQTKIHDHQCGFKGFKRTSVINFLDSVESTGWFWDTEILIRGKKAGLKITEFPVKWNDRSEDESKVNIIKDAKNMGISLLKLRWKLLPIWLRQFIKFALVGIINTSITTFLLWIFDSTIGRGYWGYPVAYSAGVISSFFLNKLFTFQDKEWTKITFLLFFNFTLVAITGLCVYTTIATIFEEVLNVHYILSGLVSTILNFVIQFILTKLLVFNKKEKPI